MLFPSTRVVLFLWLFLRKPNLIWIHQASQVVEIWSYCTSLCYCCYFASFILDLFWFKNCLLRGKWHGNSTKTPNSYPTRLFLCSGSIGSIPQTPHTPHTASSATDRDTISSRQTISEKDGGWEFLKPSFKGNHPFLQGVQTWKSFIEFLDSTYFHILDGKIVQGSSHPTYVLFSFDARGSCWPWPLHLGFLR